MAKKSKKAKKSGGEVLIVASKMKDAIRGHDCNVSSDVLEALNARVYAMIEDAVNRCKANGRKTVRGYDF
jgi:histone H3/H4